jgi:chemotaxis protein methyltransferase CheR
VSQADLHREFAFGASEFATLATMVNSLTGIVLAEHKRDMVYSRLARRVRALKMRSFTEYCNFLENDTEQTEISNLINAITTNLTSFFREEHHFYHLRDVVLPAIAQKNTRHVRLWSAACSAGMEAYSMAMVVHQHLPNIGQWDAKILATDIDTNMLEIGRAGRYPSTEKEKIPATYHSYLKEEHNTLHMSRLLQELISFKHLNLLGEWPMRGQFDVVFCRNVVIYFDKPTQVKLFNHIADILRPNGWLYIGHSESIAKTNPQFRLMGRTIYQKV